MNIVLIGLMGTGKTAVGKILAERLGWAFYDTDEMIEKETGLTVSQIFASRGEAPFRDAETQVVRLVSLLDKCVVATGGGVPLREENMRELEKSGAIVCLTASPESILERLRPQIETRPLLKGPDPLAAIQKILAERKKAYGRCKHIIDTDGLSDRQVADKVMGLLEKGIRGKG